MIKIIFLNKMFKLSQKLTNRIDAIDFPSLYHPRKGVINQYNPKTQIQL